MENIDCGIKIVDLLRKIGCENLIPLFEEHKIEMQQIPKLLAEKDMMRELIPNIGDRLNFINKYEELLSQEENNDVCVSHVENDVLLTSIILEEKDLISSINTDTSDSSGIIIAQDEHQQICNSENMLSKEIHMPHLNLTELLEQAPMGKAIISYYNNHNCLNDCLRNRLVDIIMRHVFSYHCK
ncbi:PREDICTED: uncharacterized protein LOC105559596, partial [Vollenhovia emeryi]|uniref:uncharacterized protein LOC105559596 n=1 Tax=Vollenhovia emeryi TaxID=411798 RepID=UPI0005F4EE82